MTTVHDLAAAVPWEIEFQIAACDTAMHVPGIPKYKITHYASKKEGLELALRIINTRRAPS